MLPVRPAGATTRRGLLAGGGAVAFVGLSAAALKLPFFGVEGAQVEAASCVGTDVSATDKRLIISNWPAYIDPRRKQTSTQSVFTDTYGIEVEYTDDVNDNSEFYAKVKNQLGACETVQRDMMVLTDWMAARMIDLGWIQKLDVSAIPNVTSNIIQPLRGLAWDPDFEYHVPVAERPDRHRLQLRGDRRRCARFEELLTRSDLKGKISLLTEMRDTMGFMLKVTGADPSDFDDDDWDNAIDMLRQVVADRQVRAFTGNEYIQDLAAGNIVACEAWSGDVIQAQLDNPAIKFVASRGRADALERQHARPQPGRAPGQRRRRG